MKDAVLRTLRLPPHRKHLESSGEEVIGGRAFAGIPDPHDCPGIDVLESPQQALPRTQHTEG